MLWLAPLISTSLTKLFVFQQQQLYHPALIPAVELFNRKPTTTICRSFCFFKQSIRFNIFGIDFWQRNVSHNNLIAQNLNLMFALIFNARRGQWFLIVLLFMIRSQILCINIWISQFNAISLCSMLVQFKLSFMLNCFTENCSQQTTPKGSCRIFSLCLNAVFSIRFFAVIFSKLL